MSAHEWKPGDVAMVRNEHGIWNVAICTLRSDRLGYWWRYGVAGSWSPITAEAHPLVVIDPESIEDRKRLAFAYLCTDEDASLDERFGTAIRALLEPPKPDEPTGLGAVVEDSKGRPWIRWSAGAGCVWRCAETAAFAAREYSAIAAVRVLSEGVQA